MGLLEKLNELKSAHAISMHVPGHKNKTIGNLNDIEISFDMTEIPGLDNLHEPTEILSELNERLSKKYEGYLAQALVNGSTTGVLSGLHALYDGEKTIYIVDDAHKSVHHSIELLNTTPKTIKNAEILETPIDENSIVVLTYPTYHGDVYDIKKMIAHIHSKGGKVFVDEAHGAHFDITENFPKSSMNFGADIVVQSYHKGLPSLTGASVVLVKEKHMMRRVMKYINIFETSSPSYLSLLSIESGHAFYEEFDDEVFFLMRKSVKNALEDNNITVEESYDPAKFILNKKNHSPYALEKAFRKHDIYSEMVTDRGVLWCLPLWHDGDTFPFDLLLERIRMTEVKEEQNTTTIDLSALIGKKAVRNIVPYPPGVPIIKSGDLITERDVTEIMQLRINNVKIEGLEDTLDYYTER